MGIQTDPAHVKLVKLKNMLKKLDNLAVAYSGGVDSMFLLAVAHEVLGENAIAVMAVSPVSAEHEISEAADFTSRSGIRLIKAQVDRLGLDKFKNNPPDRCYHCKREIFGKIMEISSKEGFSNVADGTNIDDDDDYRPGMKALKEHGVMSPLREAGFSKLDISLLAREMGIPAKNKPPSACLASRIPYGEMITSEKLRIIGEAEKYLRSLGFTQVRVRHHEEIGRIEVLADELNKFADMNLRKKVSEKLKELGFKFVAVELEGYKKGSLNP
ncbi:MAG: ATP-dependent sacrificial sulfur transferase LarE [Eubacteriales bacterium]|nr:ATP-dependent sacrificial sulfur transferase LarE [Eubacteriales bacterium]